MNFSNWYLICHEGFIPMVSFHILRHWYLSKGVSARAASATVDASFSLQLLRIFSNLQVNGRSLLSSSADINKVINESGFCTMATDDFDSIAETHCVYA